MFDIQGGIDSGFAEWVILESLVNLMQNLMQRVRILL